MAFQLAFTVLLFPWAILAVPVATASFPGLSAAAAVGDETLFAQRCASAMSLVTWLVFGGSAILIAAAGPGSRAVLAIGAAGGVRSAKVVIPTVIAFAPGLIGYGLYAVLLRAAFARGDGRSPSIAAAAGFGAAILLDLIAARSFEGPALVSSLGASFSIGMGIAALILIVRVRRSCGEASFTDVGLTAGRGLLAAASAASIGILIGRAVPLTSGSAQVGGALIQAILAAGIYAMVQHLLGDRQLRQAFAAIRTSK